MQEVLGAMSWYDAKKGIVVGTAGFTKFALQEAEKAGIKLVNRSMLEKLLEDYPTSPQKQNQLISDIKAENIYRRFPDFEGIIQKMVLIVLKNRDGNRGWLIEEIKSKLVLELISRDSGRVFR